MRHLRKNEVFNIKSFRTFTNVGGIKHLLTTINAFSKYVIVYPIKKANSATVIRNIFGDYIPKFGKPKEVLSDHGTQFTLEQWIKALENEDIEPILSSIRHPQSNLVERVHRELGRFFRTFVKE